MSIAAKSPGQAQLGSQFLPRDAMHKHSLCRRAASVCHVLVFHRNK